MDLTEIQKQTIAQRLRDGISIRTIAAEVGVHKRTGQTKNQTYAYVTDKDDNSANNVIGWSMTIMASQVGH
jgi:IS30 family transposase